ncbi:hypothetical protein BJX76DRAFT_367184 [Aspergillus varians]
MAEPENINHADYTFAWICALPLELTAAEAILDEHHTHPYAASQNDYILGRIADHNVVVGCLPSGMYGTNSAAAAVSRIQSRFPNVRYGLLVGIGGGAPSKTADIRLGDVVVGKPVGTLGGVIQYDLGKSVGDGNFQQTGMLNQPPALLLTAISRLESEIMRKKDVYISNELVKVLRQNPDMEASFARPIQEDRLFRSTYSHPDARASCLDCDIKEQVDRATRASTEPQIHYGTIASGNRVVKSAGERDEIARKFNAICFEMEAAGIMNNLPCLVVRGICDYSDSHKNKEWQAYAALVAAICAKRLLTFVSGSRPYQEQPSQRARSAQIMIPFDRNPRFLGREDTVRHLTAQILSSNHSKARKAAISGLGGIGKTQVALEIAHTIHREDPARSIFWIPSTTIEAVEQAFRKIGQLLRLPDEGADDIKSRVKLYLNSGRLGSWLLIIDNADDPDMWINSDTSQALKTFLPRSQDGFILFTSRNQGLATHLVGPDVIQLSELDDVTAIDLLKGSLIRKDLTEDRTSTTTLVNRLCGLPLALIQAASFLNENTMSLETYLSLLDQQEEDVVELLSANFEDDYRYPETENPNSSSIAAEYLSFMACIDPRDIPLSLLPSRNTKIEEEKALGILKAYSFVTQQTNSRFVSMHRLEGLIDGWILDVGERLSEVFPSSDHENRSLWREMGFDLDGNIRDDLPKNVGRCLIQDGRNDDAEILLLRTLSSWRRMLEANDPKLLECMSSLGEVYRDQGRLKEAEMIQVQHPDILYSMGELATTFWSQGRYKEAEALEVQVLELRKTTLGPEHPDTGRYKEAEALDVQVLELRKAILGPKHPDTLRSMGNLAATVLELRKAILGPEHPDTLTSMSILADICKGQGRVNHAVALLAQCAELQESRLGPDHPDTIDNKSKLEEWRQESRNESPLERPPSQAGPILLRQSPEP